MHSPGFPDDATLKDIERGLYVFFRAKLPRHVDPRDLVADVLLALADYRGEASVKTFAFGVARNRLAEHRRRRFRRPLEPLPSTSRLPATDPNPAVEFERRELAAAMQAELDRLPTIQGDAVMLRLEGLGPSEIAARLGVYPHTLRSRLARGFARLRDRLLATLGSSVH